MSIENGSNIGELIINKECCDQNGKLFNLHSIKGKKILLFISMHCVRCMELLPEMNSIRLPNTSIVIFSTGTQEDHEELDEFFQSKFKIVSLTPEQMEKDFLVRTHPFCIVIDDQQQVCNKGTPYNSMDVLELVRTSEENKLFKIFKSLF